MNYQHKEISMMSPLEIEKRLCCLGRVRIALLAEIPSSVRLISVEWNTNPAVFYFYFDREVSENDQDDMDEPFMHVDMDPFQEYYGKLVHADISQPIDYRGDCVYARKETFSKDTPLLLREHSQCFIDDIPALLANTKSSDTIKTFRNPQLLGFGELVDFKQTIGYYLNPTTKDNTPTTKAIVYKGKKNTYIISAVPSMDWFEKLKVELEVQNLDVSMDAHLCSELNRALLGRVIPNLLAAKIIWEPYELQLYYREKLTEEDHEDLELIWLETLAGVSEKIDLPVKLIPAKSIYDIPGDGSCFYLKKEPHS
jgi:hypothetical protein